jgi:hypothetical protein
MGKWLWCADVETKVWGKQPGGNACGKETDVQQEFVFANN